MLVFTKDQDIKLGIFSILFGLIFLTQTAKLSEKVGLFPGFCLVGIIALGALIAIKAVIDIKKRRKYFHGMSISRFFVEAAIPGSVLLIACLLLDILGFYICSFLILMAVCYLQDLLTTKTLNQGFRNFFIVLSFSIVSVIFLYVCFALLLQLPATRGIFGF
jgi:hypothetical protein